MFEKPTGPSPGASTHRSASASTPSGQKSSTITPPAGCATDVSCAPRGFSHGSSSNTMATTPASARSVMSRKTVAPRSSSVIAGSRPRTAARESPPPRPCR